MGGDCRRYCPRCHADAPRDYRACPSDGTALVDQDPLIGLVLADRYVIERELGEGGLGRVYLARHARLARHYAIKVPRGWIAGRVARGSGLGDVARARFNAEVDAASRLDHPNLASAIDAGETSGGLPYLVMDLAEGEPLRRRLVRQGRIEADEALAIARQIALGLDHAHGRGLIHRDIKPDHVVIDPAGRVRIVDFGLAVATELGASGRYTTKGIVLGTPEYMAPEQACGHAIDARVDLFALGIVLYEMLAGVPPFVGDPIDVATALVNDPLPALAERVDGLVVDPGVAHLVRWLTAKRPDDRPQRASDLVIAIDQLLGALTGGPGPRARVTPARTGRDGWPRLQSWLSSRGRVPTAPP